MNRPFYFLTLFVLFVAACAHQHEPDAQLDMSGDQSHGSEEGQSFTVYSSQIEVFAELDAVEESQAIEINGHFTLLQEGHEPLTGAKVSLQLTEDGNFVQEAVGEPVIPGIYRFVLEPGPGVHGKLHFIISSSWIQDTVVVDHFHPGGDHGHDHEEPMAATITFTKEQAWASRFKVEQVGKRPFSEVVSTSGELLAMPGEKQNIIAKTEGIILFTSRNLVQGSSVKKGDLLFTLSGKGLAVNNVAVKFNEAKTQYMLSKSNYERQRQLFAEKVVSAKQFNEYKSKYITDSVAYYSLSETVSSEGMNVYAPMSGYLHEMNVTEGQFVQTGQVLATLSANRIMLLRADLPQKYFGLLDRITTTTFRPAYSSRVYKLEEMNGRLLAKGASVAENNHYMPVYFEVTNDGSLLEGAYAEFYLKTDPVGEVVVIPVTSLIEEQNNFYVYVQTAGESYSKRYVAMEASDGIFTVVSKGLNEGERIVTDGAMLVKTASISAAPSHGHQH